MTEERRGAPEEAAKRRAGPVRRRRRRRAPAGESPRSREEQEEEGEEDEEEEEAAAAMVVQAGCVPAAPGARVEKPAGPRTRLVLFKRDAWKFHPYDCDASNSIRECAWVDDKTLWRCTDEQKGCPK